MGKMITVRYFVSKLCYSEDLTIVSYVQLQIEILKILIFDSILKGLI